MTKPNYIPDDYRIKGYVVSGNVRFTFRPMRGLDGDPLPGLALYEHSATVLRAICHELPKFIFTWNQVDRSGEPLPINAESMKMVDLETLAAMIAIVRGYSVDADPPTDPFTYLQEAWPDSCLGMLEPEYSRRGLELEPIVRKANMAYLATELG